MSNRHSFKWVGVLRHVFSIFQGSIDSQDLLQFSSFPSIPSLTSLERPWLVDQWFQECSLLISGYVFTGQQIINYIYVRIYIYITQQLRQCRRRRESSATFRLLRHVGGALLKPIRDLSWPGKHRLFNASDWRKLFLQFYRLTILAACVHSHFISPLRRDVVIANSAKILSTFVPQNRRERVAQAKDAQGGMISMSCFAQLVSNVWFDLFFDASTELGLQKA